jgi:predicted metal-dependent phosphoesterase TrpH
MIDLHIHSNCSSDGSKTPEEILEMAEELKLEYISITDHNTCKAYDELEKIDVQKIYHGKIIPGCEIKTRVLDVKIELLGYYVDKDILNKELPKIVTPYRDINKYETNKLIEILEEKKIKIKRENIIYDPEKESGQYAIIREIERYPENIKKLEGINYKDAHVFYRKYMSNPESDFYIDVSRFVPDAKEVIRLIRKAGGLVFIPHAMIYGEESQKVLQELTSSYDIDGIECYYTKFSDEETKYLLDFCDKHHLYKSGGSDFHGPTKAKIKMGIGFGNMNIPSSIIQDWKKE